MNKKKIPKQSVEIRGKRPSANEKNADSYLSKHPSWKFSKGDAEHDQWKFTETELNKELLNRLHSFESMSWSEILAASGGKTKGHGNDHHLIV